MIRRKLWENVTIKQEEWVGGLIRDIEGIKKHKKMCFSYADDGNTNWVEGVNISEQV